MKYLLLFSLFVLNINTTAQTIYYPPQILWQKCIGGSSHDRAWDFEKTIDGGYIVIGTTQSTDGDAINNPNLPIGLWVLKLDSIANIEWERFFTLSLSGSEYYSIEQTSDGGYIFGGDSVTKLDANGSTQWQFPFPCTQVRQTLDGGYAASSSYNIQKLSSGGTSEWYSHYTSNNCDLKAMHQMPDSDFLICGRYMDVTIVSEVIRTNDTNGGYNTVYQMYGLGMPRAYGLCTTFDTGYVLIGDFGAKKYNNSNALLWNQPSCPGEGVAELVDSSLIFVGGYAHAVIMKLSPQGDSLWAMGVGGTNNDKFRKILQTNDGGYIAVGSTESNDGDVSGNHGSSDIWIVKFGPDSMVNLSTTNLQKQNFFNVYPNPTKGTITITTTEGGHTELLDLQGRSLHAQDVPKGNSLIKLPAHVTPGTYILRNTGEKGTTNKILLYQP